VFIFQGRKKEIYIVEFHYRKTISRDKEEKSRRQKIGYRQGVRSCGEEKTENLNLLCEVWKSGEKSQKNLKSTLSVAIFAAKAELKKLGKSSN
jgi:hypothetical protein